MGYLYCTTSQNPDLNIKIQVHKNEDCGSWVIRLTKTQTKILIGDAIKII